MKAKGVEGISEGVVERKTPGQVLLIPTVNDS